MIRFLHHLILTVLLLCSLRPAAQGSTIFWSSQFNDLLFDSAGNPLGTTYSFEIGTFAPGFTPTEANMYLWESNWMVFDRAYDPTPGDPNDGDPEGWNSIDQFYVGTVNHNVGGGSDSPDANPLDVFTQGTVAYLWVYNSKVLDGVSEWALVADGTSLGDVVDDWIFPDPADTGSSYSWELQDADDVVFGGVNSVQGPGSFTVDPGTFSLQTHTVPVPEPGTALFILLAAGAMAVRRTQAVKTGSL